MQITKFVGANRLTSFVKAQRRRKKKGTIMGKQAEMRWKTGGIQEEKGTRKKKKN